MWEVVYIGKDPTPLPDNPAINQIKYHMKEMAKRYKTLSFIHSAVIKVIFSKIMACETAKKGVKFHVSEKSRQLQVFNLKREFALLRMKEIELVKNYIDKFMKIANQNIAWRRNY